MKRSKQKGFTLIELMIVVAIIGVLSAIAVPAYQDYVKKTELASGLATLKSLVTPSELYYQENASLSGADLNNDFGVSTNTNALGDISLLGSNDGIQFSFSDSSINGTTITYQRQTSGWTCSVSNSPSTLAIPKGCS